MAPIAIVSLDFLLRHPNALLTDPVTPQPCDRLYVPLSYVRYLSGLPRDERSHLPQYHVLLHNFARILKQLNGELEQPFHGPHGLKIYFFQSSDADFPVHPDEQAIAAAKQLSQDNPEVSILTENPALLALAAAAKVPTLAPSVALPYTGRRQVTLDALALEALKDSGDSPITGTAWQQRIDLQSPTLRPFEFIEITNSYPALRRYDAHSGLVIPLRYQKFAHPKCEDITPRTVGQRFLLEALLAPADEVPIVIVQGEFGTGKTFLSVAAGYDGVNSKRYSSVVVCPRDSRLGDDIGALPGDTDDKTRAKALGFTDNLYQVVKIAEKIPVTPKAHSTAKGRMEEFIRDAVEFVPLVEMGGRSLFERFIIYDEVQDMTPTQARALVTRLGNRSKMVVMGDLSQVNNPRLSREYNGLSYLIERLAGKAPGVAFVSMTNDEIVRHTLLREISSFL